MTPPPILAASRAWLFAWLGALVVVQAAALVGAAVATRASFAALHAGTNLAPSVLVGLAVSGMIAALCQFGLAVLAERMSQSYAGDVRAALFEHASRSAQSDLDHRRFGYHLLRFTGDLSALGTWLGRGLPRVLQGAILLPTAVAVLYWLETGFGRLGLALMLITFASLAGSAPGLFAAHKRARRARARLAADMSERLPVAAGLGAMGRRQTELGHLKDRVRAVAKTAQTRRAWAGVMRFVPEGGAALTGCAFLWIGATHSVPPATVAAALAALALIARPLTGLAVALNALAAFRAAHGNLSKALARPVRRQTTDGNGLAPAPIALEVAVAGFAPLHANAGARIGVSSALFARLAPVLSGIEPAEGMDVKLNGMDLADLTPGALRRSVALVTDTPLVLKGSLRKNIALGLRKRPPDTVLLQRISAFGLAGALHRLGGLDRSLKERAADLDAAERVTLSLLRMAVQTPGLVLFETPDLPRYQIPQDAAFTAVFHCRTGSGPITLDGDWCLLRPVSRPVSLPDTVANSCWST